MKNQNFRSPKKETRVSADSHPTQRTENRPAPAGKPLSFLSLLQEFNNLLKSVAWLILSILAAALAWLGYQQYVAPQAKIQQQEIELTKKTADLKKTQQDLEAQLKLSGEQRSQIDSLEKSQRELSALNEQQAHTIKQRDQQIEHLDLAMRLLKVDRRVARIDVLDQVEDPSTKQLRTTFSFVELGEDQLPLYDPQRYTIDGDLLYVDCWVAKFHDDLVQKQDPLRGASIYLFRRLYGENQQPSQGYTLDEKSVRPAGYALGREMSELEKKVWTGFWEYANEPEKAEQMGLRAVHGEAPFVRLQKGKRYRLQLRASGGLSINAESPGTPPQNNGL